MVTDWAPVISAAIPAVVAAYAAYVSKQNNRQLKTTKNKTIGQQIEDMQDNLTQIAADKVLADAKLLATALEAIAKLSASVDGTNGDVVDRAATRVIAEADRTAMKMAKEH